MANRFTTTYSSDRPIPRASASGVIHRNSFELTSEDLDVLTKLQGEYDRLSALKSSYSHDAARAAYDQVRDRFIAEPNDENRRALREIELNRSSFYEQFNAMSKAIGQSMRRHTAILEPEVAKVLKRLRPMVAEDLAEAKERERGLCAVYRIEFESSVVVKGLESLLADLDATISNLERGSNVTASPRSLLNRFDIELRHGAQVEDDEG